MLKYLGTSYNAGMITPYVSANFTSQDYLIPYAKAKWQAGMPSCPL